MSNNHKQLSRMAHPYSEQPIICSTPLRRLRGIYFRTISKEQWLLITRCNCVHTFFLRRSLDVIFVDREGNPLKYAFGVKPWRLAYCKGAYLTIELLTGVPLRHDQINRLACDAVKALK